MILAKLRYNIIIYVNATTHTVPKGTVIQASDSVVYPSAYLCTIPGYLLKYNLYPDLLEFLDETSETQP